MSLENEVEKESTIILSRPIDLKESKKFLVYLATEIPANIHSTVSYHINLIHVGKSRGDIAEYEVPLMIKGMVVHPFRPPSYNSFNLEPDHNKDSSKLAKIKFNTVSGCNSLSDYKLEIINIWRKVRELTDQYFILNHV